MGELAGKQQPIPIASANAQRQNHIKVRVPIGWKLALPLAATAMIFALNGCAGSSQEQAKTKGGDSVLVFQTGGQAFKTEPKAKSDTLNTLPKIVVPDVKTLQHYNPFKGTIDDSLFGTRDPQLEVFRRAWMRMEDTETPFGLPQKVVDSYSSEDKTELMRRWEIAKKEIRVAFLSDKGAKPSTALQVHTQKEINELLERWEFLRKIDRTWKDINYPMIKHD